LIEAVFSKSDSQKILDVVSFNQGYKRIKPDFGVDPKVYLRQLIEQEKHRVMEIISHRGHFNY
jgi:hypothetical protein